MRACAPDVPVVILSGHGDIAAAVEAIKTGAFDYIEKPADFERVSLTLRQALEKRQLEAEVRRVSAALDTSLEARFGTSPAIRAVIGRNAAGGADGPVGDRAGGDRHGQDARGPRDPRP